MCVYNTHTNSYWLKGKKEKSDAILESCFFCWAHSKSSNVFFFLNGRNKGSKIHQNVLFPMMNIMWLLADGGMAWYIFLVSPLPIDTCCWCNYAKAAPEKHGHLPVLIAVTQKQLSLNLLPNALPLSFLLPPVKLILILGKKSAYLKKHNPYLTQPCPPII